MSPNSAAGGDDDDASPTRGRQHDQPVQQARATPDNAGAANRREEDAKTTALAGGPEAHPDDDDAAAPADDGAADAEAEAQAEAEAEAAAAAAAEDALLPFALDANLGAGNGAPDQLEVQPPHGPAFGQLQGLPKKCRGGESGGSSGSEQEESEEASGEEDESEEGGSMQGASEEDEGSGSSSEGEEASSDEEGSDEEGGGDDEAVGNQLSHEGAVASRSFIIQHVPGAGDAMSAREKSKLIEGLRAMNLHAGNGVVTNLCGGYGNSLGAMVFLPPDTLLDCRRPVDMGNGCSCAFAQAPGGQRTVVITPGAGDDPVAWARSMLAAVADARMLRKHADMCCAASARVWGWSKLPDQRAPDGQTPAVVLLVPGNCRRLCDFLPKMSAKHVPHIAYDFVSAVADILHASRGHVERCHALPVSPALRSAFWAPGKLVLTSFCEAVDAAGGSDAIDWIAPEERANGPISRLPTKESLVWGVCRQLQGLFDGTIWGPAAAAAAPAVPFVTALGAVVQAGLALRPEERCSFEELWEAAHCENETAKLFAARAP